MVALVFQLLGNFGLLFALDEKFAGVLPPALELAVGAGLHLKLGVLSAATVSPPAQPGSCATQPSTDDTTPNPSHTQGQGQTEHHPRHLACQHTRVLLLALPTAVASASG